MAKKSNEPFKEFITIPDDSHSYTVNKALVLKDMFHYKDGELELIANPDEDVMVIINSDISSDDIKNNPSLLLKATDTAEIFKQLASKLEFVDQLARDINGVLFDHWWSTQDSNGDAYIEIEDIHFKYFGKTGTNTTSTLTDDQHLKYVKSIELLQSIKVKINLNNDNNIAYDKLSNLDYGAIESSLLVINEYTFYKSNTNKIRGISYNMKIFFNKFVKKLNKKYPTSLLQLNTRSEIVKNIGNYLVHLQRICEESQKQTSQLNLFNLMKEVGFEIKGSKYQEYIQRFISYIQKAEALLKKANKIISINIPQTINSKNYRFISITIKWKFDSMDNVVVISSNNNE